MDSLSAEAQAVLEKTRNDNVKFVDLQFTDLFGTVKSVTIPATHLAESLEKGTWFDGSSIEGFTRICESDMYLKPDPSTYSVIPWKISESGNSARLICDVYMPDGKPFEGDPRYILKKVMKEAEEMGLTYNVGPELEFFLFARDADGKIVQAPHDNGGYFDLSMDLAYGVRRDMINAVEQMGVTVEMSHHEVAEGQHEIDFRYGPALTQADNTLTMKYAFKAIATMHGTYATFMPKPIGRINGSGMHVHQSFFNKDGENVFFDANDPMKLSDIARKFVAGQLKYVKEMSAILAPTVNSYKRLVPGYEAPVYLCWGQKNRSALIRVPRYSVGREKATRCELRCPDPTANPYLAFAVMLKAGLAGIKEGLDAPTPIEDDMYEKTPSDLVAMGINTLPASLGDAIDELSGSSLMRECLGEHSFEQYLAAKNAEWESFRLAVTDWEVNTYLEKY